MEEIPSFREDVARIYRQMLLCQETEKIDKKMREEIIPEMLKNVSSMKNMRFGCEESDEENNDMNPDWEDAFEKSGLGDKLREMNELQLEGADVYMSTFAALKNYPFFREVHNWFYPFSKQQSNVLKAMKQAGNQGGSLLDLILQSGFFSNSDKYSLFFTIHQLPQSQQDMMLSQLNEQQVAELAEKSNVETMKKFNERPGTVSNQYLHDLYRFFKLSVRKSEFRDILKRSSIFIMSLHSTIYCTGKMYYSPLPISTSQRNVGTRLLKFMKSWKRLADSKERVLNITRSLAMHCRKERNMQKLSRLT